MSRTRELRRQRPANGEHEGANPDATPGRAHRLLRLQRSAGNRAVQRLLRRDAALGVVQRQPTPGAVAPIGDPVIFIEDQLKRQFVDPDDPRLYERVQRLRDAFGMLNLPERKQLSDRLRDRSTILAKNFQRLATPSREALLGILRKGLPSDIEGKVLGTLYPTGTMAGTPLVAQIEIVPSTEEAGSFGGYLDVDTARAVAVRRATVTAIVRDTRLDRYRVFETGVPISRGPGSPNVSTRETGDDFELAEWVNLEGPPIPGWDERKKRIEAAVTLRNAFLKKYGTRWTVGVGQAADPARERALKEIEEAFQALIEEAAPFTRGELHPATEIQQVSRSGGLMQLTTADPSMINFSVFSGGVHGFQAAFDPMAESPDVPGAHAKAQLPAMFTDFPAMPFEPYVMLTDALGEQPLHTSSVVLHEETHRSHSRLAIALFERWRAAGASTSFEEWVAAEVKARRLSEVEAALAIEQAKEPKRFWHFNTELLSEVEGVTSVYHAGPIGDLGLDRLPQMASMWGNADAPVQELAIRKLEHYYRRMLNPAHREAFSQKVLELLMAANSRGDYRQDFYIRLNAFSGSP